MQTQALLAASRPTRKRSRWSHARAVLLAHLFPAALAHAHVAHAQVAAPPLAPATKPLVFRDITVIDVREGRRLPQQTVVIVGNRITALGPAGQTPVPSGAEVVEARDQYMIPGLWNFGADPSKTVDVAYPLLLANGVTGVRDVGSVVPLDTLTQWKREVAAGARVGPRLIVSGPMIEQAPDSQTTVTREGNYILVPPALARHVVDSLRAAGTDMIATRGMSRDMYFAVAAAARRSGVLFGGSVPNDLSGLDASDSGTTILDGWTYFTPNVCSAEISARRLTRPPLARILNECTAAAQRLRRNNTWVAMGRGAFPVLPNSWILPKKMWPKAWVEEWAKALTTAPWRDIIAGRTADTLGSDNRPLEFRAGIPIVAGSDEHPESGIHHALLRFVIGGMTPLASLQTATLNPALALRATDSLGTVEVGKIADLVVLDADPLVDITNTTTTRAVVANGRYYDRLALDRLQAQAEPGSGGP